MMSFPKDYNLISPLIFFELIELLFYSASLYTSIYTTKLSSIRFALRDTLTVVVPQTLIILLQLN